MTNSNRIQIDFTGCHYIMEMHERIAAAFHFPEYYGRNWSAFWDLIDGLGDNTLVEIRGLAGLPQDLSWDSQKFLEILQRNKDEMAELKKRCPQVDCRFNFIVID